MVKKRTSKRYTNVTLSHLVYLLAISFVKSLLGISFIIILHLSFSISGVHPKIVLGPNRNHALSLSRVLGPRANDSFEVYRTFLCIAEVSAMHYNSTPYGVVVVVVVV